MSFAWFKIESTCNNLKRHFSEGLLLMIFQAEPMIRSFLIGNYIFCKTKRKMFAKFSFGRSLIFGLAPLHRNAKKRKRTFAQSNCTQNRTHKSHKHNAEINEISLSKLSFRLFVQHFCKQFLVKFSKIHNLKHYLQLQFIIQYLF